MPAASKRSHSARILIVDDNELGLIARKGVLSEFGHEIVTCASPREALETCSQRSFDLIVTDYRMPGMNGVEFISKLRETQPGVPVILISGFTEGLGLCGSNTGADDVIQKGSREVKDLIDAVNRLLKKPARKPPGKKQPPPESGPQTGSAGA